MTPDFVRNPPRRILRQFGAFWLPVACVAVGGSVVWPDRAAMAVLVMAAALFAAGASLRPSIAWPIWLVWMTAVRPVGHIVSLIVLALIYFLVLTPMAVAMRWIRGDYLGVRPDRVRATYWVRRPSARAAEHYYREF